MKEIVVFTKKGCAPCETVKKYIARKGFNFVTYDVETEDGLERMMRVSEGMTMVPVTYIDGETVVGLNLPRIAELLQKT